MKLSLLMLFNALAAGFFGVALVVAPVALLALYGMELGSGGVLIARLFGAALLEFAIICWMVRNAPDSAARRALILSFAVGEPLGALLCVHGQLTGVANAFGWSTVGLYAFLGGGYAWFFFQKPEPSVAPGG